MSFIKKPVAIATILGFLLAGLFTPSVFADAGSQNNQNASGQATIEENILLKLRSDGTYRLNVSTIGTKSLQRDIPQVDQDLGKLVTKENFQIRVTSTNPGEANLNVKIKDLTFSQVGLQYLNLILISLFAPKKAHELVPEQYRSMVLNALPYENWSTIDSNPVILLQSLSSEDLRNLAEQVIGQDPLALVNDELNDTVFPKFEGGSTQNIYSLLPIILPPPVPMDAELFSQNSKFWQLGIKSIESEDFSWNDATLGLTLNVKVSGEPLLNEDLSGRLPATVNMSFKDLSSSSSSNGKWRADLIVESDVKLPGFKENESWSISPPQEIQQLVRIEEAVVGSATKSSSFKIEVPKGAKLSELSQEPDSSEDQVYEWTGDGADAMINSLASGGESMKVDYSDKGGEKDDGGLPIFLIGASLAVIIVGIISFIFLRKRYF